MAQDTILFHDGRYEVYDHVRVPFPPAFQLEKAPVIVNEMMTMDGGTVGELLGWKYTDTTLEWSAMDPDDYADLKDFLANRYRCYIQAFPFENDPPSQINEPVEIRGLSCSRMRYMNDGQFVCEGVQLKVEFKYIHNYT